MAQHWEKVGRWLDHTSKMARICERHHAADRAVAALAGFPILAERVRQAVLHPEREEMT